MKNKSVSRKGTPCEERGHVFASSTSPGWFRCQRWVTAAKQCDAVAVCPGCLGFRLVGALHVFCPAHQGYTLEQFSVNFGAAQPAYEVIEAEQTSLW